MVSFEGIDSLPVLGHSPLSTRKSPEQLWVSLKIVGPPMGVFPFGVPSKPTPQKRERESAPFVALAVRGEVLGAVKAVKHSLCPEEARH